MVGMVVLVFDAKNSSLLGALMAAMAANMFGLFEVSLPSSLQNRLAAIGGLGVALVEERLADAAARVGEDAADGRFGMG